MAVSRRLVCFMYGARDGIIRLDFVVVMGDRLMAGHSTLNAVIGVRIPVPQPFMSRSGLNG
jgi:hypothetical protein